MKKNWEIKKLGEVCEIINGKNQKAVEDKNGPYPIYGSGGIMGYASEYLCRENTTIIGRKGSINNPFYVEEKFWNVDTAFGFQSKDNYLPKLLFYFCKSFDFSTHNKGTTIPSLVKSDLLEIPIPVPPLEEQKRIVKILDEKIAQLETIKTNAQTNLQNAKDLFQSQLAKAFINTTWEKKRLGDIITLLSGQDFPPERYNSENKGIPYITGASNFNEDGSILINRWTETPTVIAKRLDVLLVVKGSGYGKTTIADFAEAHIARQIMALRVSPDLERSFLFYYLNCKFDEIKQKGNGVIPGITRSDVLEMSLNLPPLPEQKRIVKELDALSEKVRQLQEIYTKQIANCDELKQAYLQKAFEGEL